MPSFLHYADLFRDFKSSGRGWGHLEWLHGRVIWNISISEACYGQGKYLPKWPQGISDNPSCHGQSSLNSGRSGCLIDSSSISVKMLG